MDAAVMARAKALLESNKDFHDALPQLIDWKQFVSFRYPVIPENVKNLHLIDWVPRPFPPLEVLCPPARFVVQSWEPVISRWLDKQPNRDVTPEKDSFMPHKIFLVGSDLHSSFRPFFSNGICRPEGSVQAGTGVLIVMDLVNLPSDLDKVLNRLFHYMELTNTKFGAVTCYTWTWLCKREGQDSQGNPLLQVSPPEDRPAAAIGFIIDEALKQGDAAATAVSTRVPSTFDMSGVLSLLKGMCEKLNVDPDHIHKILSQADVSGGFGIEDLDNIKLLSASREKNPKMIHANVRTCMKALYNGEQVVVKTRDLTSPYCIGFEGSLTRFVREVDSYLSLRKLQGHGIPKLLSWGFLRGGMFVYVITKDAGNNELESLQSGECGDLQRRTVLWSAQGALFEIHKRGILHGDIHMNKFVTKQHEPGKWTASIVGFAQSSQLEVLSQEWSLRTSKEMAELEKIITLLVTQSIHQPNRPSGASSCNTSSNTSSSSLF